MYNVICYVLKNPKVYNEGTKWETKEDTFLFCYTNLEDNEIKKVVDELNTTKPATYKGELIDWNKIAYLTTNKQEVFK